ncbi:hypothetical protein NsoK4_00860 [Nitrosopumilus sp. K4]|uniref:hypothetical protein n=1 Tax=Nitrosopumilus sp. K4 TaxID=2795383 RepID=UPI001BABB1AA|nr:hypothetical protein [Nitrosopumilus sp. K4]QUC64866.1 hypothetical protein NsoK4_00860 [Nitrosopumilus sp. K4]
MKIAFLSVLFILLAFPVSSSFSAEVTDTSPTLAVSLTSDAPYVFQDKDGYTYVVGSVKNKDQQTAVTNVSIQATFYDDINPAPLEIVKGGTVLDVIPAKGTSPYIIKSNSPNPKITQASVFLETFDSSQPKSKLLTVDLSELFVDGNLVLSGTLKNGPAPASDANVYLVLYDSFEPPRILDVRTIPVGEMNPNQESSFEFNDTINPRAVSIALFSESDVFYSDFVNAKIPQPDVMTKLVTISDVSVTDTLGNNLSQIPLGTTVKIQSNSWIELSSEHSGEIPYTYYVQVKESGEPPYVEFVGKYDGRYVGEGKQTQSVDWIPEKKGLYFVETFVWDRDNIPIADKGPIILILVN